MNLPKESIEEFRDIYEAEYGERLSFEKAERMAKKTLELFKILLSSELPASDDAPTE